MKREWKTGGEQGGRKKRRKEVRIKEKRGCLEGINKRQEGKVLEVREERERSKHAKDGRRVEEEARLTTQTNTTHKEDVSKHYLKQHLEHYCCHKCRQVKNDV